MSGESGQFGVVQDNPSRIDMALATTAGYPR
jgi:hypothetical protein